MMDGARRGQQSGGQAAALVCPTSVCQSFSDSWIETLALDVLASMKAEGDAHLYPEEQFVRHFVAGFKLALMVRPTPASR